MPTNPDDGQGVAEGVAEVIRFDLSGTSGWYFSILVAGILIYTVVMAWLFTRAILGTKNYPQPHTLVVSLTLLTFVALTAAIATNSAALETIAATGMGAIAGALSHVFTSGAGKEEDAGVSVPNQSHQQAEEDVPRLHDPEE